jgi:hypothetical protein
MKNCLHLLLASVMLISCKNKSGPDVSNIQVNLQTVRFEKDFFALDTNDLDNSLQQLFNRHQAFFPDYMQHILGISDIDSGGQALSAVKQFIHDYKPVYDSVTQTFPDLNKEESEIKDALRHVKYYFPKYTLPAKLITFIGPMDAYFEASTGISGDVITQDGLAVGLQLHLGKDFSMYSSEMGLTLYPAYLSRRFSREYIPVNAVRNIVDDIFPDQSSDKTLIEQMVEKGKRIYLIDKLMPSVADTLKTGYTALQLEGCRKNEAFIWNYFVKNGLIFNNDPSIIKNYIGDSPNTPEFGDESPGYIGLFVGWQIVKKFMEKNEGMSLDKLMVIAPGKLFEESKYRPR